jgi:hypothetical protein
MEDSDALLITGLARVLRWTIAKLEDEVAKDKDALAELDKAIEAVEAYVASDEETDAAAINERVNRLKSVLSAGPGQPIDTLTGAPVPVNNDLGPTSPGAVNTDPTQEPQTTSDPGAVTEDGELVEPDAQPHPETESK